ncbi:NAD(P)H-dependent oxidoreductase [Alkalicoccobacillus porphyridii]|uniref:NAD(P)H-dependent oxidoreductase n=1 Tax=Alkalicoccobacillus porphyridii TaxID=2597270 RepID=A0A553ZYW7_9BACI|nr:NAD(P)H-dependent oxidoreductase [Alkalicoccobacillus porphyridii]TSB46639.1 NAD(P)H-dependent oxidoreductase [Alkalicoccobacillus porphyridii]
MNLLVVYTHPNHQSLCFSFLEKVLQGAEINARVGKIKVLDLYKEKFDPALVFNQNKRRRDLYKEPELEVYREQILWADKIVFIYPIWWGRPPAMLLGYIDQIFVSNFAYKEIGRYIPEGLLKEKSIVCISTMKGPKHYPLLFINNAHKALMKKALFRYIGIRKVKFFEFGSMEDVNKGQKKKLQKIYQYMSEVAN